MYIKIYVVNGLAIKKINTVFNIVPVRSPKAPQSWEFNKSFTLLLKHDEGNKKSDLF